MWTPLAALLLTPRWSIRAGSGKQVSELCMCMYLRGQRNIMYIPSDFYLFIFLWMQTKSGLPLRSVNTLLSHLLCPRSCGQEHHSPFTLMICTGLCSCLLWDLPLAAIVFPPTSPASPCCPVWPLQSCFLIPSPRKSSHFKWLLTAQCGHKYTRSKSQVYLAHLYHVHLLAVKWYLHLLTVLHTGISHAWRLCHGLWSPTEQPQRYSLYFPTEVAFPKQAFGHLCCGRLEWVR